MYEAAPRSHEPRFEKRGIPTTPMHDVYRKIRARMTIEGGDKLDTIKFPIKIKNVTVKRLQVTYLIGTLEQTTEFDVDTPTILSE